MHLNKLKGKFTDKEVRLLEILLGTIAISIENARLYRELKQYASSLEQENRMLKSEVQECFNLQGVIGSSHAMRQNKALDPVRQEVAFNIVGLDPTYCITSSFLLRRALSVMILCEARRTVKP